MDTIYALSSGAPPAAIAIIRISGPRADQALLALAGRLPPPRRASLRALRDPVSGALLDNGLILRFPGPDSATGEDLAELHLHGGRSVVAAVTRALHQIEGLRQAQPGEFTRRAFANGRIDLAEAEGLGDLLLAETETQRRAALALAGGALSRKVQSWQDRLLLLAAELEAVIDHSDEEDVEAHARPHSADPLRLLKDEIERTLQAPSAERLRDGIRIVIAGPPNAGKSSLFNVLAGREAAITSAIPGTTRDVVEAPTAISGSPFLLVDTAGLRDSSDEIERIGIERALGSVSSADVLLWLGAPVDSPSPDAVIVESKGDLRDGPPPSGTDVRVSAKTGEGVEQLIELLLARSRDLLPKEDEVAINDRHRTLLAEAILHLTEAAAMPDELIAAEALRQARSVLDRITGRAGVEDMLDALFARFCIGK